MSKSGFRVVRPEDRTPDKASGVMVREAAISGDLVGARELWVGYVELPPGAMSAVHHHGDSESAIYLISGRGRFCAGDELNEVFEANEGDFVWVPPHVPHVEINASDTDPVRMAVVRSTQEALVVNLATPTGWKRPR
jgi:uncharacterized RmlC-like cupin family protein